MDIHRANIGKHQKECWKFKTNWQNNSSVAKSTFPNMWHPADNCRKLIKKKLTYVFGNLFHFSVLSVMMENSQQTEFDDTNSYFLYSLQFEIYNQISTKEIQRWFNFSRDQFWEDFFFKNKKQRKWNLQTFRKLSIVLIKIKLL